VTQVAIELSTDDGDNWVFVTKTGGVLQGNPDWQNFPWVVPDSTTTQARIWVHQYGQEALGGRSGLFSIGTTRTTQPTVAKSVALPGVSQVMGGPSFALGSGGHRFLCAVAAGDAPRLRIVGLDGALVAELAVPARPGYHTVAWDGRDARGRPASSGVYLANVVR